MPKAKSSKRQTAIDGTEENTSTSRRFQAPPKVVGKKIDHDRYEAHVKANDGGEVTISDAISKDGKTRTQRVVGVNANGRSVDNTEVFQKQ